MSYVDFFGSSYDEIKKEFGLKRRRAAQELVSSAMRKFRDHLTIMILLENYDKPASELTEVDVDRISTTFASLKQREIIEDYLSRNGVL